MNYYAGPLAAVVDALEKKGVRFDIGDREDGKIIIDYQNVMILRGAALEAVSSGLKRPKSRIAGLKALISFRNRHCYAAIVREARYEMVKGCAVELRKWFHCGMGGRA